MSTDYFSHKPRSFLSRHADVDEKLAAAGAHGDDRVDGGGGGGGGVDASPRGRRPTKLPGYHFPAHTPALHDSTSAATAILTGPRVPRTRTLLRLLGLGALALLLTLGWRCEAVGCKGRAGGALVGEYVGGGSVVAGGRLEEVGRWPSWGGERMDGEVVEGSSVFGVGVEVVDGGVDDGDLDMDMDVTTNMKSEDGQLVEWDKEEEGLSAGNAAEWDDKVVDEVLADEVKLEDQQPQSQPQPQSEQQSTNTNTPDDQPTGPVGELTGPIEGANQVITAQAAAQAAEPETSSSDATTGGPSSWLGAVDLGLW